METPPTDTSEEDNEGTRSGSRQPSQQSPGAPPPDWQPSQTAPDHQPPPRAAGTGYGGVPPSARAEGVSPTLRGPPLAFHPILLPRPGALGSAPPAHRHLYQQPLHPLPFAYTDAGELGDIEPGRYTPGLHHRSGPEAGPPPAHASFTARRPEGPWRAFPGPRLVVRPVRPMHPRPEGAAANAALDAAAPPGAAPPPLVYLIPSYGAPPRTAPGVATPALGVVRHRSGLQGHPAGAAWGLDPRAAAHGPPYGLPPLQPQPAQHLQHPEYGQHQHPLRPVTEPGAAGPLRRASAAAGEQSGDSRGAAEGGEQEGSPASPSELSPATGTQERIEVTVAVRVAAGGRRQPRGGDAAAESRAGYTRGPVSGVFDVPRYLAGRDCIHNSGRWMSRSNFERVGGSKMAKWYRSIRVLPDLEPLGDWLERHNMPVTKGPARRSSKRPADSGDELGLGQVHETVESPDMAGSSGGDAMVAAAAGASASAAQEYDYEPTSHDDRLVAQQGGAGVDGEGDGGHVRRMLTSTSPLPHHLIRLPLRNSEGPNRTAEGLYSIPSGRSWGAAAAQSAAAGDAGMGQQASGEVDEDGGDDVATLQWLLRQTGRSRGLRGTAQDPQPQPQSPPAQQQVLITPSMQVPIRWAEPQQDPSLSRPTRRHRPSQPDEPSPEPETGLLPAAGGDTTGGGGRMPLARQEPRHSPSYGLRPGLVLQGLPAAAGPASARDEPDRPHFYPYALSGPPGRPYYQVARRPTGGPFTLPRGGGGGAGGGGGGGGRGGGGGSGAGGGAGGGGGYGELAPGHPGAVGAPPDSASVRQWQQHAFGAAARDGSQQEERRHKQRQPYQREGEQGQEQEGGPGEGEEAEEDQGRFRPQDQSSRDEQASPSPPPQQQQQYHYQHPHPHQHQLEQQQHEELEGYATRHRAMRRRRQQQRGSSAEEEEEWDPQSQAAGSGMLPQPIPGYQSIRPSLATVYPLAHMRSQEGAWRSAQPPLPGRRRSPSEWTHSPEDQQPPE
uniref:RlsC n=1 Tax=Yamagishiella unicocca TaxID=51707 RepID=A0A1W6R6N4_9CHLO|nr:RlsC [Yamagishiella unicocca]